MEQTEKKYRTLRLQWRGYTIKEFVQRAHITYTDVDNQEDNVDDVAKNLFEQNKERIFNQMSDEEKREWAYWDATGNYPTKQDKLKNGGKDFEDTIKDKYPTSADDLDDYEMRLPWPCNLRIEAHCITAELMITQTNFQSRQHKGEDEEATTDDVYVFEDEFIQEMLTERENDTVSGVKKVEPGVTVFLWSKSMTRAGQIMQIQGSSFMSGVGQKMVGWLDLSEFVVGMETNVSHDGGRFSIRFQFLASDNGEDMYAAEEADGTLIAGGNGNIFRLSKHHAKTWTKTSKFAKVDTNTPEARSFFHSVFSPNDLLLLSFTSELEPVDTAKRYENNVNLELLNTYNEYIDSDNIAKVASQNAFDMIGLVDNVVFSKNSARGSLEIEVTGRDLSKLLIDDGTFFFNFSTTKDPSRIFYNEQGYAKQGDVRDVTDGVELAVNRMRKPMGGVDIFYNQINQSIDYVIKGVLSQLANIEIVPSNTFEYWDNRTRWLDTHPDDEIIEKENKRTRTNEGGGDNGGGEDTFDKPVE